MADATPLDILVRGVEALEGLKNRYEASSADIKDVQQRIGEQSKQFDSIIVALSAIQTELHRREDREDATLKHAVAARENATSALFNGVKAVWADPTVRSLLVVAFAGWLGISFDLIRWGSP